MRIAIGAVLFEGNTLSPLVNTLQDFENKYLVAGPELVPGLRGSGTEMAGAIRALEVAGAGIVPLIATHGGAGGTVGRDAYARLRGDLLGRLRAAGEVDGVYLALHGAMICQGEDDPEGDMLAAVREIVGGDVPVAASCDLHANVTPRMVGSADILIGYQLYPHDDTFETGERATGLLVRAVEGRIRPVTRMRKLAAIFPAQRQRTRGDTPMAEFYKTARAREALGQCLAASYFPVQPWLDLPDIGFAAVVVTDGDPEAAERLATEMAGEAWRRRREFESRLWSPAEAIAAGLKAEGRPVMLVDAADCVGGGAAGDSAIVLKALLEGAPGEPAAVLIVDPETAEAARRAGEGRRFAARIGNKLDPRYGAPVETEAEVARLFDGRFTYRGGLMGGVTASMGPSALLRVGDGGAVQVVASTYSSYEYADEQFRAAGVDARRCRFVVVKNPMNFQNAYDFASATFFLSTPGPTTPELAGVPWEHIRRPFYPLDDGPEPIFRA